MAKATTSAKAGFLILSFSVLYACSKGPIKSPQLPVETGIAQTLAEYRKQVLSDINYAIHLNIPESKATPIKASETIHFNLKSKQQPLQLDFKEQRDHLHQVVVNEVDVPVVFEKEHLIIHPEYLKEGYNQVYIEFTAGDLSLNRSDEYLYTLLVPDRARTVFPVFDQPDLKATFTLTLTLPEDWKAIANAPLQDSVVTAENKTYHYQTSDTISTYLFSFAAGEFQEINRTVDGRTMRFLHRETDKSKLEQSLDPIFNIHGESLAFMEDYTQIPYPFQKFDFIAIPDFQYGGMEHVGAIDYKASTLFLDEGATQDQKISRSNLIAHETAHMWFGDLVTMRWFNDVWMKEVFANFMADKISKTTIENSNYNLKFLLAHFPAAYGVDRTAGANPIRQNLENLQDAGSLYGNIIYHKAPIVMRQLERLMGEEKFKQGLQVYLKKYAHGNATWPELIQILDELTPTDLNSWNKVWVNETGRPQIDYQLQTEGNKITTLLVSQKGEDGAARVWPQLFEIALVYPDRIEELTVNMNDSQVTLKEAAGKEKPLYMLFNSTGQGYGQFPVDSIMLPQLYTLKDPVMRASASINLYENMLSGRFVGPAQLLNTFRKGLINEPEELNLRLLTGYLSDIYWSYTSPEKRAALAPALEKQLWDAMQQVKGSNSKKILFKTYQSIALTKDAQQKLYTIWEKQQAPAGVTLTEDDYTSLALALAVSNYPDSEKILAQQKERIKNPDRKKRLEFMLPALSGNVQERDAFFASLKDAKNREKEAWVGSALSYLHHPLRTRTSVKYLKESLELLEEIQLTGDIFFPTSWLNSTLSSYQTPEAAAIIRSFLEANPTYNPKLKGKILQAADGVFRAEKLVGEK